ncbi:hypothetical protein C8Q80DRAFT_1265605 [Daedaleopsis nitida]|nr:hypothetical protein C8Q80DRAFT_1265605 [Daedaleopsis nitida]
MAPVPATTQADFTIPSPIPIHYSAAMRNQWSNPKDVLSILMIVGGDIVQRAIAQLAGTGPGPFTPVAFSFGWVAYSISMLVSAIGDGRLLPQPDCPSVLVRADSGYVRTNQSWVLGRLLRDEEHRLERQHSPRHERGRGLTIAFYRTAASGTAGLCAKDWVYVTGVGVMISQLAIAIGLFIGYGDWVVFLVTTAGTLLACIGSALPQWRREKYAARAVKKREVCCLTRGNGAPVVMVVRADRGRKLEDLAGAKNEHCRFTLSATATLCVLWILLLLTVQGLDGHAWALFAIGALGMAQNVLAAGARRTPHGLGLPLDEDKILHRPKVMDVLKEAEEEERGVGLALLPIFFPGALRKDEQQWWDEKRAGLQHNLLPADDKNHSLPLTLSSLDRLNDLGTESHRGSQSIASSVTAGSVTPPLQVEGVLDNALSPTASQHEVQHSVSQNEVSCDTKDIRPFSLHTPRAVPNGVHGRTVLREPSLRRSGARHIASEEPQSSPTLDIMTHGEKKSDGN